MASKKKARDLILVEKIEPRILLIRGQKVLLDADLAALYGVTTKRLNEQVKRNALVSGELHSFASFSSFSACCLKILVSVRKYSSVLVLSKPSCAACLM